MKKICLVILLVSWSWLVSQNQPKNDVSKTSILDEATAIRIAVKAWIPIYGKKQIEHEKPYKAVPKGDVWYVDGYVPDGMKGGAVHAEIAKKDGHIIMITHYK